MIWENQYLDLMQDVMLNGEYKEDRTGTGTISSFGAMIKVDLQKEFPAVTTKKLAFKSVVSELLWFLEGSTDERRLAEILYGKPAAELVGKNTIWTANADAQGAALGYTNTNTVKELGPVYGKQWRDFGGVDQIVNAINTIKTNPDSRRIIVNAWNPPELDKAALPPCHYSFQFQVLNGKLNLLFNMRSNDLALGAPFNFASYAILCHMVAQVCDLEVGTLVYSGADVHVYSNHVEGVTEQLSREPFKAPKLIINPDVKSIFDFKMSDFELEGYEHHPTINMPMAV